MLSDHWQHSMTGTMFPNITATSITLMTGARSGARTTVTQASSLVYKIVHLLQRPSGNQSFHLRLLVCLLLLLLLLVVVFCLLASFLMGKSQPPKLKLELTRNFPSNVWNKYLSLNGVFCNEVRYRSKLSSNHLVHLNLICVFT